MKVGFTLLSCILLAGCLSSSKAGVSSVSCDISSCPGAAGSLERDNCVLDVSVRCGSGGLCGSIVNKDVEYHCLLKHNMFDPLVCAGIADSGVKRECYYSGAQLLNDTGLCERIVERKQRDLCLSEIAYRTNTRIICNNITYQDRRKFCFAVADRDGTGCSPLIDLDIREMCIDWTMKKLPASGSAVL